MFLDSPPTIEDSQIMLPLRAFVKVIGGQVTWDAGERKVTVELGGGKTIELWIGKSMARGNGGWFYIDPANPDSFPEIIKGRTMIPLCFVTDILGCITYWDETTKTIVIYSYIF